MTIEFNSYDKKRCKKILINLTRDDKTIIRRTLIFGSVFLAFGFFIVLAEILSKNSNMTVNEKIIFAVAYFPLGYLLFFIMFGINVMMNINYMARKLNSTYVYEKITIDTSSHLILLHKKEKYEIDFNEIDYIGFLTISEMLLLLKMYGINHQLKVRLIKISSKEISYYIVVDTIKESDKFLEELSKIKTIEPAKETK